MKQERFDLGNKALFKGKDLKLVNELKRKLGEGGIYYMLGGSVVSNALNGRPRNYHDIDVFFNDRFLGVGETFSSLVDDFSKGFAVISYSYSPPIDYVGESIRARAFIRDKNTKIDLCSNSEWSINL